MSAREEDINGYITIKKNPISKVGVFPYLGRSISKDLEPTKIYWVYRPAEELCKPETIESFKNIPIINDHTMLGKGATPAEQKGVEGVTGSDVFLEGDTFYADLKIYSDRLKHEIDVEGKKELSMGYRVGEWEATSGTFNGQFYDFIQRKIVGNHIALVDEGRCGPEVAVLDNNWVYDAMEICAEDSKVTLTRKNNGSVIQVHTFKTVEQAKKQVEAYSKGGYAGQDKPLKWEGPLKASQQVFVGTSPKGDEYAKKEYIIEVKDDMVEDDNEGIKRLNALRKKNNTMKIGSPEQKAVAKEIAALASKYDPIVKQRIKQIEATKAQIKNEKDPKKLKQAKELLNMLVGDTASDGTESPAAEDTTEDSDTTEKGTAMADTEEKQAMTMDDVKAFIKGHAKDRKTFDKLMDEMRPAEDEGETKEKEGDQTLDKEDDKKKAEDAEEKKAEDAEKEKDAQDAAIKGLRSEMEALKKNGMKTLMSEINKRNALAKEVEEVFGTFDHAEMTAEDVAAYGTQKANIKVAKGQEAAAWSGFYAGRRQAKPMIGVAMDRKEVAPKGSLIAETLKASQ